MKIKTKLREAFRMYFILVTLITVLLMILGLTLDKDRVFGYEVFMSPLLYAGIGIIPVFFLWRRKGNKYETAPYAKTRLTGDN